MKYAKYEGNVIVALADIPQPALGITTEVADDHQDVIAFLAPPMPQITLNKRQFYTALALQQFITMEEADAAMAGNALPAALQAIIDAIPDAQTRFVAKGKLLHGSNYLSNDEMVPGIAAAQNLTTEQVMQFFQFASQI